MKDWPFFAGFAVGALSMGYVGLCAGFVLARWQNKLLKWVEKGMPS